MVRSRLSRQVLHLYKDFLRAARGKPGFKERIRGEFLQYSKMPLSESLRIEYLLRRGKRQLELLQSANVKEFHFIGTPSAPLSNTDVDTASTMPRRLKK